MNLLTLLSARHQKDHYFDGDADRVHVSGGDEYQTVSPFE